MKLFHLSDLHLGIRVNEFPMIEEQEYILKEILREIDRESPDGILIAGDIYDKSVPPAEAVALFDDFLYSLSRRKTQVYIISGNHDSPERLAFGSRLMDHSGIHISPVYTGEIQPEMLTDAFGPVRIFMLPFLKPAHVRRYFEDEEITSYTDAVRTAVSKMELHPEERNILITHQFVTGARRSDSEEISVGGTDNIDASVFNGFDYVALGHIHSPQNCSSERIRYCGTPLKYSFSEAKDQKSITVVELAEKGSLSVRTIPLTPRHDLREIRGTYEELTLRSYYVDTTYPEDYLHITLTDENDIPDAVSRLRVIYHHLMKLDYDNKRTRSNAVIEADNAMKSKTPFELFSDFYELQNNQPMTEEQSAFVAEQIASIWEEET